MKATFHILISFFLVVVMTIPESEVPMDLLTVRFYSQVTTVAMHISDYTLEAQANLKVCKCELFSLETVDCSTAKEAMN